MEEKTPNSIEANNAIYEAIRQIATHRFVNPQTGAFKNTERKTGYICKIHTDKDDELCGTVDVQEFNISAKFNNGIQDGLHEGVYLSAIQDNKNGILLVPMLYSEVVIATDPVSLKEYVVLFSHVDQIQLESHQQVSIGVSETKEIEDGDDTPDFDELEKTGEYSKTSYNKNSILNKVANKKQESQCVITPDKVENTHDKAVSLLDDNQNSIKFGDSEVVVTEKQATIKSDEVLMGGSNANEPAVLGNQLASIMIEFLDAMSQMKTTTLMGVQPPINLGQFISLKMKIQSYKNSVSGFLSKTVKLKQ